MKKVPKRFLCLLLCAALTVLPLTSAAGDGLPEAKRGCPLITVRGFMSAHILSDAGEPDSTELWPPSAGAIVSAVGKCLPGLFGFIFLHSDRLICKELQKNALPILTALSLAPDGTPADKSGVSFTLPAPEEVTPESKFDYFYDWRLDPVAEAARLNDFINYIADCSGCGKVIVHCYSYGSTITAACAALYGTEKVKTFVFNSTALFGVNSVGEMLNGKVALEPEALTAYLDCLLNGSKAEGLVDGLVKVLNFTGFVRRLCALGNKLIENCGDDIISVFAGWPSMWAMVPDAQLKDARAHVFGSVFDDADRSALIEKIDGYNSTVRTDRVDILNNINNNCNFYVISRYGGCSIFLTPSYRMNADTVIDAAASSFGAFAADYGSTLPTERLSAADPALISPDKTLDATGCLFPDRTWFVKGVTHTGSLGDFNRAVDVMLASDEQLTVNSFKEMPRFSGYDKASKSVVPNK